MKKSELHHKIESLESKVHYLEKQVQQLNCVHNDTSFQYNPRRFDFELGRVYDEVCNYCDKVLEIGILEEDKLKREIERNKKQLKEIESKK